MKTLDAWHLQAACQGVDTELFYPEEQTSKVSKPAQGLTKQELVAVAYCNRCPVVEQCLRDALKTERELDFGIRGGLPRRKRLKIRNRLGR